MFKALVFFGMLNAAAYSCLLPLWEGFDEGYHYGYVQSLSTKGSFPVLGKATLSKEIWHAYQLMPVSQYLQPFTKAPVNFTDYFNTTEEIRRERRKQLESLPSAEKFEPQSDKPNYEVNQAPLPYVFMAIVDRSLSSASLPVRVLWLRLICSSIAAALLAHATFLIGQEFSLPAFYLNAVLFCTFSSQMVLAVISHVSNDCFAIPAMGYLIWASIRAARTDQPSDYLRMSLALAAALLIKAYFLFLIPLPCVIAAWALSNKRLYAKSAIWFAAPLLVFVAPWYARNLILYNNLSGTVESTSGLGFQRLTAAAWQLPWRESIRYMAHSSLWTGNNSFTTFSSTTLNLVLFLLALGTLLYLLRPRLVAGEVVLVSAILLFSGGTAAISVAFFASSGGAVISAVPWYQQVLVMPVLMLVLLGLHRWKRLGAAICAGMILMWTYLLLATFWAKLLPLYGGFPQGKVQFGPLFDWYVHQSFSRDSILRTVCLAPPGMLWLLLLSSTLAAFVFSGLLLTRGWKQFTIERAAIRKAPSH